MDRIQPLRIMAGHLSDVDVSSSFFLPSLIFFFCIIVPFPFPFTLISVV